MRHCGPLQSRPESTPSCRTRDRAAVRAEGLLWRPVLPPLSPNRESWSRPVLSWVWLSVGRKGEGKTPLTPSCFPPSSPRYTAADAAHVTSAAVHFASTTNCRLSLPWCIRPQHPLPSTSIRDSDELGRPVVGGGGEGDGGAFLRRRHMGGYFLIERAPMTAVTSRQASGYGQGHQSRGRVAALAFSHSRVLCRRWPTGRHDGGIVVHRARWRANVLSALSSLMWFPESKIESIPYRILPACL